MDFINENDDDLAVTIVQLFLQNKRANDFSKM